MTEAQWLSSDDPAAMLNYVLSVPHDAPPRTVSDRKLRLFACAVAWGMNPGHWGGAIRGVEAWAEGGRPPHDLPGRGLFFCDPDACQAAWYSTNREVGSLYRGEPEVPQAAIAALLREVAGNRWRPVRLPPACRTPDALALAHAAYDLRPGRECPEKYGDGWHRSPDYVSEKWACETCGGTGRIEDGSLDPVRLAVLADALEEAGCTDEAALAHLRSGGPHVRGCFVLDAVLGRD